MTLAACGRSDDGPLDVVFIDSPTALQADGVRLSAGAQHLRGAIGAGLVSLDEKGEPVPALADRWIVTDDGLSYIFRLREGGWANGQPLTAESARAELRKALDRLRGTS
ncbi:MAG: ABC transporter substrate-binding protein, partial [Croceibacterium sp.]